VSSTAIEDLLARSGQYVRRSRVHGALVMAALLILMLLILFDGLWPPPPDRGLKSPQTSGIPG
jgi:hypothetical protein